ncbi:uncharacterized protein LOC120544936 isoform X2 [Perca fluviatilis]|uniref:uncharacterized protein LOC120544936 isoform X2 n=1 Tax=Perca fluviatilis TaxID=8168 RepID=UPI0019629AEB|nr:uncharacterized protein LOC120544936 isoform X2 [Perca fluviatilis]
MCQSAGQDEWRKARSHHLSCLLSCNVVPEKNCSHCTSPAIIRCRDCMPEEWLCTECDTHIHKKHTLHNRESCIGGIYKPIEPTVCCVKQDGGYTLVNQVCLLPTVRTVQLCTCDPATITESAGRAIIMVCINGRYDLHLPNLSCKLCLAQWTPDMSDLIRSGYWPASVNADTLFSVDVFTSFEELKTVAPSFSRQVFLEKRTCQFGRTAGRGICGASRWSAACETARRASKLDEEGIEVVVCRHRVLLKALNMYRGEIFAYPLFLQKELQTATNGQFFCTDIACKYWPYLEKLSVSMSELRPLLQMRPFLSVMHAKAHSTKNNLEWQKSRGCWYNCRGGGRNGKQLPLSLCPHNQVHDKIWNDMLTVHAIGWNRRKQDGLHLALSSRYVKTCEKAEAESQRLEDLSSQLGCPENMVHQWVHDVREWASDDSAGTRCDDQQPLQESIEEMFLAVHHRKASLYNQTDNKIRQLQGRKLGEDKKKLFEKKSSCTMSRLQMRSASLRIRWKADSLWWKETVGQTV